MYDFISQHKINREGEWVFKNQSQTACSDVNEHSPAAFANLYWILVHQTEKENKLGAWLLREAWVLLSHFVSLLQFKLKGEKKANNMQLKAKLDI